jgi:hypothetical protein
MEAATAQYEPTSRQKEQRYVSYHHDRASHPLNIGDTPWFLLHGVKRDHRLAISRMLNDLSRQVAELGPTVLMLMTFSHLCIRLQPET